MKTANIWSLVRRINRRLANSEQVLRRQRGAVLTSNFGEWAIWSPRFNFANETFVDPIELAARLGIPKYQLEKYGR